MGNKGDYGYFGKGSSGYAHYMQAFNESSHSSGGRSGRNNNNNNSSGDGCLIYVLGGFLFSIVVLASDGLEDGGMIFIYLLLIIICLGTIFWADNAGSSVKASQNQKSTSSKQIEHTESTSSTKPKSQKYINIRNNIIAVLAIILFFGSIIVAFYTLRTEDQTVESEILSLASSGHYQQAFDRIENYYPDRSERERLEEKVKSMMPEKERVKMFPEDYIRFTLILNLKEQIVNGKREEAYKFVDLIYINNSQYDVKIFNIDSYYINEYSFLMQRNIEYETVLKRYTHQGHDEYYDERPYFNDNYIIWDTTRFNVSGFDIEVLD